MEVAVGELADGTEGEMFAGGLHLWRHERKYRRYRDSGRRMTQASTEKG